MKFQKYCSADKDRLMKMNIKGTYVIAKLLALHLLITILAGKTEYGKLNSTPAESQATSFRHSLSYTNHVSSYLILAQCHYSKTTTRMQKFMAEFGQERER
jgi:hypothetical protein